MTTKYGGYILSLLNISQPPRQAEKSYSVFFFKKKKKKKTKKTNKKKKTIKPIKMRTY